MEEKGGTDLTRAHTYTLCTSSSGCKFACIIILRANIFPTCCCWRERRAGNQVIRGNWLVHNICMRLNMSARTLNTIAATAGPAGPPSLHLYIYYCSNFCLLNCARRSLARQQQPLCVKFAYTQSPSSVTNTQHCAEIDGAPRLERGRWGKDAPTYNLGH